MTRIVVDVPSDMAKAYVDSGLGFLYKGPIQSLSPSNTEEVDAIPQVRVAQHGIDGSVKHGSGMSLPVLGSSATKPPETAPNESDLWEIPKWYVPPKWQNLVEIALSSPVFGGAACYGPTGTGKSITVRAACTKLKRPFVVFPCTRDTVWDDFRGYVGISSGSTMVAASALQEACEGDGGRGKVLIVEEANYAHPGVPSGFNTLCDQTRSGLTLQDGRVVRPGPNFRVVLCFNDGYAGTREINPATLNRFLSVETDYLPKELEITALRAQISCTKEEATRVVDLANNIRAGAAKLDFDLSPRTLLQWVALVRAGYRWKEAFELSVLALIGSSRNEIAAEIRESILQIALAADIGKWEDMDKIETLSRPGQPKPMGFGDIPIPKSAVLKRNSIIGGGN